MTAESIDPTDEVPEADVLDQQRDALATELDSTPAEQEAVDPADLLDQTTPVGEDEDDEDAYPRDEY